MTNEAFIRNAITAANVVELTKRTLVKVGYVYLKPLPDPIVEEKISKAITRHLNKEA